MSKLPEHLALEPRCAIWPWVSQRLSWGSLCNGSEDEFEFEFEFEND